MKITSLLIQKGTVLMSSFAVCVIIGLLYTGMQALANDTSTDFFGKKTPEKHDHLK